MASTGFMTFCFVVSLISFLSSLSVAIVPDSQTFKYVNEGEFGDYVTEYNARYRVLPIAASPFQLCFYSVTTNAYHLALRMGTTRSESTFRWVWEANRNAPVSENATLAFGRDGNLVLANPDGHAVWSTATANKGVVGLRLLPTGNLVLYDSKGKFVWQSFDHPTDTLLVGQSLRLGGPNKLVSRVSDANGSEGPYSFVVEPTALSLYLAVPGIKNPISYSGTMYGVTGNTLVAVTLTSEPETTEAFAYELKMELTEKGPYEAGSFFAGRPKYNSTLSFLRIGSDGNLKSYTFYDKVDYRAWDTPFAVFAPDGRLFGCSLPAKCGSFGVCEDEMCVACPRPQGLLGWSKNSCQAPKIGSCGGRVDYYRVEGVEHFLSQWNDGEGPVKLTACRDKCTKDCKCAGFVYKRESSKCLLVPVIGTLAKGDNAAHSVYIKIAK